MTEKIKQIGFSLGLLICLGLLWGSGYTLARYATTHGATPLGYAFWQSAGPTVLVLLIVLVSGTRVPLSWHYVRFYVVCGFIGIALPNTNMYYAAPHLPAGLLAVIVNTAPVLTYVFALWGRLERFSMTRLCGVVLGVIGIMMLVILPGNLSGPIQHLAALLALLTPLSFAACAVYAAKYRPLETDSLALTVGMMCCSTLLLTPIVLGSGHFYILKPPFTTTDWVILLEILLSSIGYVIFFQLLKMAGPVFYSLVGGVVALTGLFWGRLIFRETLNLSQMVAVSFVLLAIVIVSLGQRSYRVKNRHKN